MSGKLIILTGPTASGKDAIMHKLLKNNPSYLRIITATTREPRKFEQEGIDYYFLSEESFKEKEQNGEFLETNLYSGNLYGTPKSEFKKALDGNTVIWRVDATMAARAKDFLDSEIAERTLVIYINSRLEFLHKRLSKRGMSEEEIQRRIKQDSDNWEACREKFDKVVFNEEDRLDETVEEVAKIIEGS